MIRIYWLWLFGWRTIEFNHGRVSDMWGASMAPFVEFRMLRHPSLAALRDYTFHYTHRINKHKGEE